MLVMKIDHLVEGKIVKRPSKLVRSPYVADVIINNDEVLAHTASLGCCGLCETNSSILFVPMKNKNLIQILKNVYIVLSYLLLMKKTMKLLLVFILNLLSF